MRSTALAGVLVSVGVAVAGLVPGVAAAASQTASGRTQVLDGIVITHPRRAVVATKRKPKPKPRHKKKAKARPATKTTRQEVGATVAASQAGLPASAGITPPAATDPTPTAPAPSLTVPIQPLPAPTPISPPAAPAITGTTYYVSPSGSDSNSGTSPAQAWQTVARVNAAHLNPGDGVLFEGGQTFADQVLMPSVSGTGQAPIVFGSYGQGSATISQGAWFIQNNLAFENLAFNGTFQGGSATNGSSSGITLDGVSISLPDGNQSLGLFSNGDNWVIEYSTIQNTGLSGMLLNGDDYLIIGNTISDVGLSTTNGYNNHGIYLKASNATVTGNTITNFSDSAVSVRYHNSTVTGNTLSGGQIGIDFYQTDTVPGSSVWTDNTISQTTVASIFVCGTAQGCEEPLESFTIGGNTLSKASGIYLNLQPTSGTYTVADNATD
jgi:putative cofactor-binding repeat protein